MTQLNSPYRPPSSTDNETARHGMAYIAARGLLRLVTVVATANLVLGLIAGFSYMVTRATDDPLGMVLACGVIATVNYLSTSAYAAFRFASAVGPRLSIYGVFGETCLFTALLLAILFSLASLPSRYLGYPLSDILPWYNDLYLLIPSVPLACIVSVEISRRLARWRFDKSKPH